MNCSTSFSWRKYSLLFKWVIQDSHHLPGTDWCYLSGSRLRPWWACKEQGGGAPHGLRHNWWIEGTSLAQIDSGGLAAHGRPGLEVGQLWILRPRPGPHLSKTIRREKSEAQPPSACSIQEDQQNSLGGFNISRRLSSPHPHLCFFPQVRL